MTDIKPTSRDIHSSVRSDAPTTSTTSTSTPTSVASGPVSNVSRPPVADVEGAPQRPGTEKIPCPFVATEYNQGRLNPDERGFVSINQLVYRMTQHGYKELGAYALLKLFDLQDKRDSGGFNLFDMREGPLNHRGSTGIRDPKVDPKNLPRLLSFGENGRMYERSFVSFMNSYAPHSTQSGTGTNAEGAIKQAAEFALALTTWGRRDGGGEPYLTNDDCKRVWLLATDPAGYRPAPPNTHSVEDVLVQGATMSAKGFVKKVKDFVTGFWS